MGPKLLEAVGVDIAQPDSQSVPKVGHLYPMPVDGLKLSFIHPKRPSLHACSTSGNLSPLLHAIELPSSIRVRLAFHVIIIVGSAPSTNKKGRAL